MRYFEESYADVISELKELLPHHYNEVVLYSDVIPLDPAYDIYEILYAQGACRFITCRDDEGKLIGYLIVILQPDLHAQNTLKATTDNIYVSPDHRHTQVAEELIRTAETIFKEDEVSVFSVSFTSDNPCRSLMDKLEFDRTEIMYTKYLGN